MHRRCVDDLWSGERVAGFNDGLESRPVGRSIRSFRTPEEHKDLESILDELMTNGLRHKRLKWHYRSRHEGFITFFTGLRGDQIDLTRTRSKGVRDLKFFLDFAERGPRALVAATTSSANSDLDSEFERMVADRIRAAGFEVHHQVGCSGYRIDLAVVDPTAPGRYLLGVECDGATYHRAATARDRDKLRQLVLEDLGWKLHRIWSTDWWHDPVGQMAKLLAVVAKEQEARETKVKSKEIAESDFQVAAEILDLSDSNAEASEHSPLQTAPASIGGVYQATDFSGFHAIIYPDRFHDQGYDATLADFIAHVIYQESPILEDLLVQRISRAQGFQKSGSRIRERIVALAERNCHAEQEQTGGRFFWIDGNAPTQWNQFRVPSSADHLRSIEEIPLRELRAASSGCKGTDLPVEIARQFGILRLSAGGRARIEVMLDLRS